MQTIGPILIGLSLVVVVGLLIVAYVAWREARRGEDAQGPDQKAQRPIWRPGGDK